ncbi:MAG TPA: hypothetical protein VFF06_10480 [Polyangia bacterium]|nr:hypothetical protein [Polyangia bacterium]
MDADGNPLPDPYGVIDSGLTSDPFGDNRRRRPRAPQPEKPEEAPAPPPESDANDDSK